MRRLHLAAQHVETGSGLLDGRLWMKPAHERQPTAETRQHACSSASRLQRRHHVDGNPDLACQTANRAGVLEWRDANDRQLLAVDRDATANDINIGVEAPLPETVADHRDGISSRYRVFLVEKYAALLRDDAKNVEVVRGHSFTPDLFDLMGVAECELTDAVCREPDEHAVAVSKLHVARIRRRFVRPLAFAGIELDDFLGIRERPRAQQRGVEDREDRAVRANARRQRQDRYDRKPRVAPHHALAVHEILGEIVVPAPRYIPARFFGCDDTPEVEARRAPRLSRRQTLTHVLVGRFLEVTTKLVADVSILLIAAQEPSEAREQRAQGVWLGFHVLTAYSSSCGLSTCGPHLIRCWTP